MGALGLLEEFFCVGFVVLALGDTLFASAVAGHSTIQPNFTDRSFVRFSKIAVHTDGENVAVRVIAELFE